MPPTVAGSNTGTRAVKWTSVVQAAAEAVGAIALAIDDERYPPLLRAIYDPPPLLYVRGDPAVLSQAQLAVVGSRRASPAGLASMVTALVNQLAKSAQRASMQTLLA